MPDLLATWLARGWLTAVVLPEVGTPETVGSLVLDPFAGTGTVLAAAARLGRRAVGFDLALTYAQMAQVRLAAPLLDAPEVAATAASQPALI